MDLDLAQVRAFVAAADEMHFGRAAEGIYLSQQALSKRIARLEEMLGVRLFDRTGHAVELTEPGRRFLEPARQALAAGDRAVTAAREDDRPLRLDVWGRLFFPMRSVRELIEAEPGLDLLVGVRRDLAAAVAGFQRDELDVAFGRVPAGPDALPGFLAHRLVRLDPLAVVLSADHPLARAGTLRPADLRETRLWFPAPLPLLDFMVQFIERFGLTGDFGGANLGLDYFLEHLRESPDQVSILPADVPLPEDSGIRSIPLADPVPLYAWSLVWRRDDQHPLLEPLLAGLGRTVRRSGWLRYDPARHWLPDTEDAVLRGAS